MPQAVDLCVDWEAEYNVRLLHPDRKEFHSRCVAESDAAYGSLRCVRNVRYGEGERALLDYFPAADEPISEVSPLVAFFHGGYWHSHERAEYAFVARTFARAGIATALVGYDLAPAVSMDEIVLQARSACRWLRGHAADLGFDANLVFTAGHSAGAHLAVCALIDKSLPSVKGAVLVSGIFDLAPLRLTSLNKPLGLTAGSARRLSPARRDFPPAGDVLLAIGAFETTEFLRQSRQFAEKWQARARTAELLVVPAVHHYSIILELAQPESALSRAAVNRVLRTAARPYRRTRARRARRA